MKRNLLRIITSLVDFSLIRGDESMEILEYIPLLSIVRVVKEIAELLFYSFAIVYIVKNIKK